MPDRPDGETDQPEAQAEAHGPGQCAIDDGDRARRAAEQDMLGQRPMDRDRESRHRVELFEAARVRLGSPGVIVEAELQCVPAFLLEAREQAEPLADVVPAFVERCRTADHLEFYWFPGTDVALTKENTRRPLGDGVDPVGAFRSTVMDGILANGVYGLMWLGIACLWLAVGRSRITEPGDPA